MHGSNLGAERRRSRGSIAQARVSGRNVAARAEIRYSSAVLRFNTLLIALCVVAATFGCSKEEKKPPVAPGGNGFQSSGVGSKGDAGPKDSGGPVDASFDIDASAVTGECTNVSPGDYLAANNGVTSDGTLLTGVSNPPDFMVTRVLATWGDSCLEPTIKILLSDGKCPNGKAPDKQQSLQILLLAGAIDGTASGAVPITGGLNTISSDPENASITVQYTRPKDLTPHGRWGSCAGMPGTLTLTNDLATTRLARLAGTFAFDLSVCDGSATNTDQAVNGTFNVQLRRGREDACPTK